MTPEEIITRALTANMPFFDDGCIDCSHFSCVSCTFNTHGCNYYKTSNDLDARGINLFNECKKLLPLYREQRPKLFL